MTQRHVEGLVIGYLRALRERRRRDRRRRADRRANAKPGRRTGRERRHRHA